MCLNSVQSIEENFDGIGYKSVDVDTEYEDNNYRIRKTKNPFTYLFGGARYFFGKWYTANEESEIASDSRRYTTGFHIFLSKEGAQNWGGPKVVQVSFKEAHTVGIQSAYICVIARKMRIDKVIE